MANIDDYIYQKRKGELYITLFVSIVVKILDILGSISFIIDMGEKHAGAVEEGEPEPYGDTYILIMKFCLAFSIFMTALTSFTFVAELKKKVAYGLRFRYRYLNLARLSLKVEMLLSVVSSYCGTRLFRAYEFTTILGFGFLIFGAFAAVHVAALEYYAIKGFDKPETGEMISECHNLTQTVEQESNYN